MGFGECFGVGDGFGEALADSVEEALGEGVGEGDDSVGGTVGEDSVAAEDSGEGEVGGSEAVGAGDEASGELSAGDTVIEPVGAGLANRLANGRQNANEAKNKRGFINKAEAGLWGVTLTNRLRVAKIFHMSDHCLL